MPYPKAASGLVSLLVVACAAGAKPAYRQNPQPTQAYRVTMTIDRAPGPFAQMLALAQYDVVNPECLPPPNENPGGHTSGIPTEDIEIPLTRVSENRYVGTVHADRMLDEDYHGRGVCHWKLIQARVHMKATGAQKETLFIPNIQGASLLAGRPEIEYFSSLAYPETEEGEFVYLGLNDRSRFGPSITDADLFTVTFKPEREVTAR